MEKETISLMSRKRVRQKNTYISHSLSIHLGFREILIDIKHNFFLLYQSNRSLESRRGATSRRAPFGEHGAFRSVKHACITHARRRESNTPRRSPSPSQWNGTSLPRWLALFLSPSISLCVCVCVRVYFSLCLCSPPLSLFLLCACVVSLFLGLSLALASREK